MTSSRKQYKAIKYLRIILKSRKKPWIMCLHSHHNPLRREIIEKFVEASHRSKSNAKKFKSYSSLSNFSSPTNLKCKKASFKKASHFDSHKFGKSKNAWRRRISKRRHPGMVCGIFIETCSGTLKESCDFEATAKELMDIFKFRYTNFCENVMSIWQKSFEEWEHWWMDW